MANQINFTQEQIAQLNAITGNNSGNYAAAYRYIYDMIKASPNVDQSTKYWFQKASEINGNAIDSTANTYIRSVTESGRKWDGLTAGDSQATSNLIGARVIGDIARFEGIQQFNTLVSADIQVAVSRNDQTAGGWGGSFYYWNAHWSNDGRTVGQVIVNSPAELEKFLAVNAKAVLDALRKHGASPTVDNVRDVLGSGITSQVPESIKAEIARRVGQAIATPELGVAGDPNNINLTFEPQSTLIGYKPIFHDDGFTVIGWQLNNQQVVDPNLIQRLNTIRDIRLQKSADDQWKLSGADRLSEADGGTTTTLDKAGEDGTELQIKVTPGKRIESVEERDVSGAKRKVEYGGDGDSYHARETQTDATGANTKYIAYLKGVIAGPNGGLVRVANEQVDIRENESGFERIVEISSIKYTDVATGQSVNGTVTQAKINGNIVALTEFGTSFGSLLGRTLANGNVAAEIGLSSILGTLTGAAVKLIAQGAVGPLLGWSTGPASFEQALGDTLATLPANFAANLAGSVGGALSSLVMAELADALDLSGFENQVFQSVGASFTSRFVSNAWSIATNGGTANDNDVDWRMDQTYAIVA